MNILSLFDGISCGRVALARAGAKVDNYYACEIDKFATQISQDNYPCIIRLGDVLNWREWDINWREIDLVFGGFPCQTWSVSGSQSGDKDERGMLFWVMLDIIKHVKYHNPSANFLIENVKMKNDFEQYITQHTQNALGEVHKILINSALVSAQNRQRYYWTSFEVKQPSDKGVLLVDVLQTNIDECFYYSEKAQQYMNRGNDKWLKKGTCRATRYTQFVNNEKSFTLTANMHKGIPYNYFNATVDSNGKSYALTASYSAGSNAKYSVKNRQRTLTPVELTDDDNGMTSGGVRYRKLTPVECERLQTLPDDYTKAVSNTQRYKSIGNGWTVDVIAHILSFMDGGKHEA